MKLATVSAYDLPGGSKIELTSNKTSSWAVRNGFGSALNSDGEWEHEPQPSSRDDAYLARCRHPSPEAAYEHWLKFDGVDFQVSTVDAAAIAAGELEVPQEAPKVYIVLAYRWGWINNGHYFVKVLVDDLDGAIEAADEEARDRGGKYGVVVLECTAEGERRVHYAASIYGEDREHTNYRIETFREVGQAMYFASVDGYINIVDPKSVTPTGGGVLMMVDVVAPHWLDDEVRRRLEHNNLMQAMDEDRHQRLKAGLPARTGDEHGAWFKEVCANVDANVERVFEKLKQKRLAAAEVDGGGQVVVAPGANDGGIDGGDGGD